MRLFILRNISIDKWVLMLFLCHIFFTKKGICQNKDTTFQSKNVLYADFSTSGPLYSINFDRIFYQNKKINLCYQIGISILEDDIAIPLGISLFSGKKNSHVDYSLVAIPCIFDYKSFLSKNDLSDKCIYIVPGIGYRYQKPTGGIFLKVLISPMIFLDPPSGDFWNMDPSLDFAINIGIGLTF